MEFVDVVILSVSIHAPAWGRTNTDTRTATGISRFNSRMRVGCDKG